MTRGGQVWSDANSVAGVKGKAIKLGGKKAGQYIQVTLGPAVNLGRDDFTVSFWFKSEAPDSHS